MIILCVRYPSANLDVRVEREGMQTIFELV